MKYLIMEDFVGRPVPFIFPDRVTHTDLREQLPYPRVLAAGYVALHNGGFVCSGADAEVGAAARDEDAAIIAAFFAPETETKTEKHRPA